jgi:hypothetical protein
MTRTNKTWTKKRVVVIVVVAFAYGIWFNILDSAAYCEDRKNGEDCVPNVPIGNMFVIGDKNVYQPWNIIGHCIPGLFMLLLQPRKIELFVAGVLISSAVMDSPLWGVAKLYVYDLPLWHEVTVVNINGTTTSNCYAPTESLSDWIVYYYNPSGTCQLWEGDGFPWAGLPTGALMLLSLIGRLVGGAALIWWQNRQESLGKEFSLSNILLKRLGKIKINQSAKGKP